MIRPDLNEDLWIFGYGSLMWNPGFDHEEVVGGTVHGFHRCLCVRSTLYRGTPDNPGLVMGLDEGGTCTGRALRVMAENVAATMVYLDEREQVNEVYCPQFVPTKLHDGREVTAYTYVVRREHRQYVQLSMDEQASLVAKGIGNRGTAIDYLANTIEHMDALGIKDTDLHRVLVKAQALNA